MSCPSKIHKSYYVYSPIYGWLRSNSSYWKQLKHFECIIYSQPFDEYIGDKKCISVIASYMLSCGAEVDIFKRSEWFERGDS